MPDILTENTYLFCLSLTDFWACYKSHHLHVMSSESFEGWPYIELYIIVFLTSIQGGRASFFFFNSASSQTNSEACRGGRGEWRSSLSSNPAASTGQSGLFTGLSCLAELMNHESVDRWVSQAVFRSHVSMWLHAASPWGWYAYVSLSPVRFPQLIYFTMALWKVLVAATLSLPHSFTILLSNILGCSLVPLYTCWNLK